jgi:hypothetical protein
MGIKDRGQSLSTCYRSWKARGRPASRRTSSTVDVLAPRHPLQCDGGDGGNMAKKDAVSMRLAREIALAELLKTVPPFFTLEELPAPELPAPELPAPPALEELPALLQLGGPYHGGLGSSYERGAAEKPILDAFKAFGLDHRSLSDWRALVFHLAHVLFPTPRPPGAPRKWTDERLCQLLAEVAAAKRKHPNASDTVICKWLEKRYRPVSAARLRRVLQDAGNPARNRVLAEAALALVTPQIRGAARALTDEELRSRVIWWAIQTADKFWGH